MVKTIILGDFNINFLNSNIDPNLEIVMNSYALHDIVEEPTRTGTNSQTIIDQVILKESLWEYNCQVIDTGFSDHYAQILELHNIKRENSISKKSYKIVRPINDTNKEYLNYLLENQSWENVCKQTSVNAASSEFLDIFNYCFEIAMPKLRVKILQHSWITTVIKKSSRRLKF